jgi:hypothetical protein
VFLHWGEAMGLPEIVVSVRGGTKIMPPIFFLVNISTVILKFTYVMGTSCTKLRLFFHILCSIIALSPLV